MTDFPTETVQYGDRLRKERAEFDVGDVILGRYRVAGLLGRGGMGAVYRCFDMVGGIPVALKALPPDVCFSADEMDEIRANFQLVERLHHPNIAAAKTLERDDETRQYYVILEYVEGQSLRHLCRSDDAPLRRDVLALLRQVADALDYAHSQGVVHRDIKPSNIMVEEGGGVKILDFGLAAQIHASLSRVSTARHGTGGTAPYMAPEQWRGRYQDGLTDQYALGVLAYEMLAGRLPFDCPDASSLREAALQEECEDIHALPPAAMQAIRKAMAKERHERHPSCSAFVTELEHACASDPVARRRGWRGRVGGSGRRAVAGVVVVAALAALHITSWFGDGDPAAPPNGGGKPEPGLVTNRVYDPVIVPFRQRHLHWMTGNAFSPFGSESPVDWTAFRPVLELPGAADVRPVDLVSDAMLELVMVEEAALVVRARDGEELWRRALSPPGGERTYVGVCDLDDDGVPELSLNRYTTEGRYELLFLDRTGRTEVRRFFVAGADAHTTVRPVATGDLDEDGRTETVVMVAPGHTLRPRELRVYETETGLQRLRRRLTGTELQTAIGDVDGDGVAEILTAGNAAHNFTTAPGMVDLRSYLTACTSRRHLWNTSLGTDRLSTVLGDVDGDGVLDIVAGRSQCDRPGPHEVHVVGLEDGRSQLRCLVPVDTRTAMLPGMAVGDMAPEAGNEILAAYANGQLVLLDARLRVLRHTSVGHGLRGMTVCDVDGDGRPEILTLGNGTLRALDGNLSEEWRYVAGDGLTQVQTADMDVDGRVEIVLSGDRLVVLGTYVPR